MGINRENKEIMTDVGIKKLILVSALEAEMQGVIADNKQREIEGLRMAYTGEDFSKIANEMENIACRHDEDMF